MSSIAARTMPQRMLAAAKLDIDVYEEVEADTSATGQAAGVVAVVALCSAVVGLGSSGTDAMKALLSALVGWALWAGITYIIGDKLLKGTATWGELLRTLGFAQAPGVLFLLAWIPGVGIGIYAVVRLWIIIAGIIAVRQALDFGTGRALATVIIGIIPVIALDLLLRIS